MKKIILALFLTISLLTAHSQNQIEFIGLPIGTTSKAKMADNLIQKGYKYVGELDGYVMYTGQFVGSEASVTLVPDSGDGLKAVGVSLDELSPVRMGQLFTELMQKYMLKYSDYKYTTTVKPGGGTQVLFRKQNANGLLDCISIESKIKNNNCSLSIFYGCNIEDDTKETNAQTTGIGIDDI